MQAAMLGRNPAYPESDGKPMAENTRQWKWIVLIKENLESVFMDDPLVFVAGDLLWYPNRVEQAEAALENGGPGTDWGESGEGELLRAAADVMLVFGRPKGDRGAYLQWEEDGIPAQVTFEILPPSNTAAEMERKRRFYERHGVEEYYVYDPPTNHLEGWRSVGRRLRPIPEMHGYVSRRMGIRFDLSGPELVIYRPDGTPFLSSLEVHALCREHERWLREAENETRRLRRAQRKAERNIEQAKRDAERVREEKAQAEQARSVAEQAKQPAEQAKQQAEQAKQAAERARRERCEAEERVARLEAQLRALGIDVD